MRELLSCSERLLNPLSLPLHHRLRHRRDFSLVYRKGLRRSSRNLTLRALRWHSHIEKHDLLSTTSSDVERMASASESVSSLSNSQTESGQRQVQYHESQLSSEGAYVKDVTHDPSRLGVSISQKVSKKAVVRNRIKRHLKAAFRQLRPRITAGWLIVIVVRPSAVQCDYWQFLQELEQMLISAEVIDGHS